MKTRDLEMTPFFDFYKPRRRRRIMGNAAEPRFAHFALTQAALPIAVAKL